MIQTIIYVLLIIAVLLLILLVLKFAKRLNSTTTEEKIIEELLPGLDCSRCGNATCGQFAKKLSESKTSLNECPYISKNKYKKCKHILEKKQEVKFSSVAFVRCKGGSDCQDKFKYVGDETCASKNLMHSGDKVCPFACLGCGDCVKVCPYNAISISDKGCAVVNKSKCTGCGECVYACPNKLITMVSYEQFVGVVCNSSESEKKLQSDCKVSCIHCGACESICPNGAIMMVDGLPKIDDKKCIKCGKCISVCPNHVISRI